MDCEACTDRLLDLLDEELEASEGETVRAHLDGCEPCAEALERLEDGQRLATMMAMVEPPAGLLDGVLAAAREKALERAPEPSAGATVAAPPRADLDEDEGIWAGMLKWVGGLAMRPQLAMAMTLVLMVGIGLWYLPELRRSDPADSQAIVDPTPGDEVGPSAGLAPADRLDLETDPRTGRIVPVDPNAERIAVRAPRPEVPRNGRDGDEEDEALPLRVAEAPTGAAELDSILDQAPNVGGEVISAPLDLPEGMGEVQIAAGESYGGADEPAEAQADVPTEAVRAQALALAPPPSRPAMAAPADDGLGAAPRVAASAQSASAQRPSAQRPSTQRPSPRPSAAPTPAAASGEQSPASNSSGTYARGMQRFRARDYRGAATDFDSVVRRPDGNSASILPSALHQLARSHRAAGDCRTALSSYERLFQQYSSYGATGQALVEAGDCYRRVGRLSQARRTLERAAQIASVETAARRELTRVAAAEQAQDRDRGATDTSFEEAEAAPAED